MIHSPEIDQLAAALVAVQAAMPTIPKDATNPFFKSAYADLPAVIEKASPIITEHGLCVAQLIGCDEQGDTLTTMLIHSSGQYLSDTARLHLVKEDPQSHGSATTYMRRYAYMAILGLVADVDDDANAASRVAAAFTPPKQAAPKSAPAHRPPPLAAVPNGGGPMTREQIEALRRQAADNKGGAQ